MTHLRLQKLLYYVQGWSLALRHAPLFNERIEAWAHGPVVRDLYSTFAGYGSGEIPREKFGDPENLTDDEFQLIGSVWESYKQYTAMGLRAMTHAESPWKDARGSCSPADKCDAEITHDAMREFFAKRL